jgi:hypothetical protein
MKFKDLQPGDRFTLSSDKQNELFEKTERHREYNAISILTGEATFILSGRAVKLEIKKEIYYQPVLL